ncbi:MAG: DUF1223 domain-containing protein [Pseudomonadota bacterium]
MSTRRQILGLGVGALAGWAVRPAAAQRAEPAPRATVGSPVVVELFTSQGCNSCPPADAFLGELAARPGILAIGLHVDYWDYIGWKDPYAQPAHTERQRQYARALAQRYVYTPQMVIDGRFQDVGSERAAIERLIARAARDQAATSAERPRIDLRLEGAASEVRVEGGTFRGQASVWIAAYDRAHLTAVTRGENRGRRLANYNVVRVWRRLGAFAGSPVALALDLATIPASCDRVAILVQADGSGPILAAIDFALPKG